MEEKTRTIYCPRCGRKVGSWDGKTQINIFTSCRKCYVGVIFYPETGETKTKKMPQRNSSSGLTFI